MSWRVGTKVLLNVYDDDGEPVCQCHTPTQARRIVEAINYCEAAKQKETTCLMPEQRAALLDALAEAERKASENLGRYKFLMFGYWAAIWVHLNRIEGTKRPNPWKEHVNAARLNRDMPEAKE